MEAHHTGLINRSFNSGAFLKKSNKTLARSVRANAEFYEVHQRQSAPMHLSREQDRRLTCLIDTVNETEFDIIKARKLRETEDAKRNTSSSHASGQETLVLIDDSGGRINNIKDSELVHTALGNNRLGETEKHPEVSKANLIKMRDIFKQFDNI